MLHLPILRQGRPYDSIDQVELVDHATGQPLATVSQANPGLITRDLHRMDAGALESIPMLDLLAICRKAADLFRSAELPAGDSPQSFDDYIAQLSATTGMPRTLCRSNAQKIFRVLDEMPGVVAGLTRGFDLTVLDRGYGSDDGRMLSWYREARVFGAVLPSNSPGVHSLWIPALALKAPTVVKPGRQEPWTPLRALEALAAAGLPRQAMGFYPAGHGGSAALLQAASRSMLFGDAATTGPWRSQDRVQVHGPGFSKIILGPDAAENWKQYVDVMVESILANGGRSCINASAIWTPSHADEIADELAHRLAPVQALAADDPAAQLAAFTDPQSAHRIDAAIAAALPEAADVTLQHRASPRLVPRGRCAYLLPTIIRCDPEHPLANREYLFPYASVIQCPAAEMPHRIGPTLVATAITADADLLSALMACADIDRLNLGPIPTCRLSWDQPHEGNLFEHLYRQRALQIA